MLLRLSFLYKKSPKMCRELEDIISDLKGSLVPRPLYFVGVENEGLVFTVCACTTF